MKKSENDEKKREEKIANKRRYKKRSWEWNERRDMNRIESAYYTYESGSGKCFLTKDLIYWYTNEEILHSSNIGLGAKYVIREKTIFLQKLVQLIFKHGLYESADSRQESDWSIYISWTFPISLFQLNVTVIDILSLYLYGGILPVLTL